MSEINKTGLVILEGVDDNTCNQQVEKKGLWMIMYNRKLRTLHSKVPVNRNPGQL